MTNHSGPLVVSNILRMLDAPPVAVDDYLASAPPSAELWSAIARGGEEARHAAAILMAQAIAACLAAEEGAKSIERRFSGVGETLPIPLSAPVDFLRELAEDRDLYEKLAADAKRGDSPGTARETTLSLLLDRLALRARSRLERGSPPVLKPPIPINGANGVHRKPRR